MTYIPPSTHDILYNGTVYYVDASSPDDTRDGLSPETAKKTIGAAIVAASDGDAIVVKGGTYTETGIDLNKDNIDLVGNKGVILSPATGTALTITGDDCKVDGFLRIIPAAGETGIDVDGTRGIFDKVRVLGGAVGWDIDGTANEFYNCQADDTEAGGAAFDIGADANKFWNCGTVGNTTSYGYKINNGAGIITLVNCDSRDNETSGFYVDTGSSQCLIKGCASGRSDGRWTDVDSANVWIDFYYDKLIHKTLTLDGSASFNLFKVTGAVQINYIYGVVETALAADITGAYLNLFDGAATVEVTDNAGVNLSSLPAGSFMSKANLATSVMEFKSSATAAISEVAGNIFAQFTALQKTAGVNTYIRLTRAGLGASGVITWHVDWEPLSDDGFVEPV